MIRLKINKDDVFPKYVFYFTQSSVYWKNVLKEREGQLKKGINAKMLSKFKIPLPPLEEQKAIAERLKAIDDLIEIKRKEKEQIEKAKKKVMDLLLTGKVRIKTQILNQPQPIKP